MSLKTVLTAVAFSAMSTLAIAQTATQPATPANPLRPTTPAQPVAPAQPAARPAVAPAPAAAAPTRPATAAMVNLNTAPASELDNLPQIGAARSAAIIAKRPYKDWNDFVAKNVVPANAEAAIKDKVRFR